MKRYLILLLLFFNFNFTQAQNLNQYRFIEIPETYDFTSGIDQYQLNSLTKFLFNKEGFNTYMKREEKPEAFKQDPCDVLNVQVSDNSSMFNTKLTIKLEDCRGKVVFESEEGRSKDKDYKKAYHEALREAFESVRELNYKYAPETSEKDRGKALSINSTVKKLDTVIDNKSNEDTEVKTSAEAINNSQIAKSNGEIKYFTLGNNQYELKPLESGFGFFQKESLEPFAVLITTGKSGVYLYKSLTYTGVAYFDSGEDLIVEYMDSSKEHFQIRYLAD